MVFEQSELEDAVLANFSNIFEGSRVPIFSPEVGRSQEDITLLEIEQILSGSTHTFKEDHFESKVCSPYTFIELEESLKSLPNGKAAGFDNISNEMLKNSSHLSRLYLQTCLNQIIADGAVPEDLNIGKCMLIFKVYSLTHTNPNIKTFNRGVIPFSPANTGPSPSPPTSCAY